MIKEINGQQYYELIDYGIRNLSLYKDRVNALNVFPVPDGDTGTNMLVTLQSGLDGISDGEKELSDISKQFARAVTFGARGNSGVIISQFFKGISETFYGLKSVDCGQFVEALENGVACAYKAVPRPVEGTILTVVREAAEYVRHQLESGCIQTLNDVIDVYLDKAKLSLEETPQLLEVLHAAGVVDSGGAGIIYVFEGMEKYLKNEELPESAEDETKPKAQDYSRFHKDSVFEFGYCTELLLQLTNSAEQFEYASFQSEIKSYGDSIVSVLEEDKLKLHIHTSTPESVLTYCHRFGEFLNLKIENMSVQHQQLYTEEPPAAYGDGNMFSVVAVAHNSAMKQAFLEMGADYVIQADYQQPPAASDFLDAFSRSVPDVIVVFPNNKNTELSAIQAQRLCGNKKVLVAATRSDAQCYAVLPLIDYNSESAQGVLAQITEVTDNLEIVAISRVQKSTIFDGRSIQEGNYVSVCDHELKAVHENLERVCVETVRKVLSQRDCEVITVFLGKMDHATAQSVCLFVNEQYPYTEITVVQTDDDFYHAVLSFE